MYFYLYLLILNWGIIIIYWEDGNNRIIRNKVVRNGVQQEEDNGIIVGNENIVDNNCVKNNVGAGIFVRAGISTIDNVIRSNKSQGNNPDIEDNGTDTLFDDNKCTTSDPDGLCQINNEVIVNEGESIQTAIDNATEGLTIRVSAGTFNEALIINNIGQDRNRIRIIGAGRRKTVIDGTNIAGAIGIDINSSFITIENLTVQNFNSNGIRVNTSDNILHCVNVFGNQDDGINIEIPAERNMVMNCESSRNIGGVSDGINVRGNHNYIVCNQFNRNDDDGIDSDGAFNLLLHNFCDGNKDDGINTDGDSHFVIGNCASNNVNEGIDIDTNSDFNLVLWNKTCGNRSDGIRVPSNNLIWGNHSCNNNGSDGIEVSGDNNRIIKNILKNNKGEGIRIQDPSAEFNIIDNNKIIKNNLAGILLENNANDNAVRSNCLIGNTPDINDEGMGNVIDENKCQTSIPDGLCKDC